MIQSLITERQFYRNEAVREVSKSWAGSQTIGGPILTLTTKNENVDKEGNKFYTYNRHHYMPDSLIYNVEVIPEKRRRGIYEILLYTAKINISGSIDLEAINEKFPNQKFDQSFLSVNVSDLKGIQNDPQLKINESAFSLLPGLKNRDVYQNGLFTDVQLNENTNKFDFNLELNLNGIDDLSFLPVGKSTMVNVKSSWNNPSFSGTYLPFARTINKNGFNADWKVNHFNRSFPQSWDDNTENVFQSAFGIKFLIPVDEYQQSMRTSKYGLMLIVLTFLSLFMIELFAKIAIHPIQYLLVGLALVIFYSLLLSISEYLSFDLSYLISSLLVISLISIYVKNVYKSFMVGGLIFTALTVFYGFMYTILLLQDYSLLIGNIALFLILAAVMMLTRKLNWFEVLKPKTN
jgi:inner membrane protein